MPGLEQRSLEGKRDRDSDRDRERHRGRDDRGRDDRGRDDRGRDDRGRDDRGRDDRGRDDRDRDMGKGRDRNRSKDKKHDKERDVVRASRLEKTSSGHRAGIHSASEFGDSERTLKRQRDKELAEFNAKHAGQNEETVYRDKRGRKLDMLNEFMRQQASGAEKEARQAAVAQAQYEWGKGRVQQQQRADAQQELEDMASQPFARTAEDPQLERLRREAVHEGDPMAAFFNAKAEKKRRQLEQQLDQQEAVELVAMSSSSSGGGGVGRVRAKPRYKGPQPPPNRFQIQPGYRWDAVDRGNGFEKRIMTKINSGTAFDEDRYKWAVSDL